MTSSAICQWFQVVAVDVLLVTAHPRRWAMRLLSPLLPIVIVACLAGCECPRDATFSSAWWKSYKSLNSEYGQGKDRTESIKVWTEEANDETADRRSRSEAIFTIFKVHVRPGFTSADCRSVTGHAKWLEACSIERVAGVGGWVPVEGDWIYVITLFPDEKRRSDYHIYFTLSGLKEEPVPSLEQWNRKGRDFLRGSVAETDVRLRQFALCYPAKPQSKIERFTDRGVVLLENR